MLRRLFRIGLWLGLLAGVVYLLAKLLREEPPSTIDLGSRGGSLGPTPDAWPPLEAPEPTLSPIQVPEPEVGPLEGTTEPGLITIGDEPFHTPPEAVRASLSAPPPAPRPPAKKAGPKKAPAKKKAAPKKAAAKKAAAKKQAPPPEH